MKTTGHNYSAYSRLKYPTARHGVLYSTLASPESQVGQFPLLGATLLSLRHAPFQLGTFQREHDQISWFTVRAVPKSLANIVR